ncbi:uncharacterized protein K452DRAFT_312906 [Aplosporella prunicola CBS 121167]|uniref:Uncharacterized protein n=1 Tax=Aplosporella prunicola CBS 121167 TaxID=1176127 RepID=A0A6A6AYV0_9PEZI|nr:uncharacterized protein K452DRAFT_312906 [Aplosporella prunicola CBS 121167]KAF2136796.1 hypothetical protein K452DRAFT_312906 [Aplosporella prunicola CBS 121167]
MAESSTSDPYDPAEHSETGPNPDDRISAPDEMHSSTDTQTALTVQPKMFEQSRVGLDIEMNYLWNRLKNIIITKGILNAEEVTGNQYDKKERIPEGLHASWSPELISQRVKWRMRTITWSKFYPFRSEEDWLVRVDHFYYQGCSADHELIVLFAVKKNLPKLLRLIRPTVPMQVTTSPENVAMVFNSDLEYIEWAKTMLIKTRKNDSESDQSDICVLGNFLRGISLGYINDQVPVHINDQQTSSRPEDTAPAVARDKSDLSNEISGSQDVPVSPSSKEQNKQEKDAPLKHSQPENIKSGNQNDRAYDIKSSKNSQYYLGHDPSDDESEYGNPELKMEEKKLDNERVINGNTDHRSRSTASENPSTGEKFSFSHSTDELKDTKLRIRSFEATIRVQRHSIADSEEIEHTKDSIVLMLTEEAATLRGNSRKLEKETTTLRENSRKLGEEFEDLRGKKRLLEDECAELRRAKRRHS